MIFAGMIKKIIPLFFILIVADVFAQKPADTVVIGQKVITLSTVLVNNKFNVPSFIEKIQNDTSFYKAFKNLHVLGYTAYNDIRILNKDGSSKASLNSKTKQSVNNGCRTMQTLQQQVTGDMFDADSNFNYYTAQMYASLFFTKGAVCGENNIVGNKEFSTEGKSGIDKHKEQLKMLFFDPGKKITGIPFVSNKTAVFDDDMADRYDMNIDMDDYNKTSCYIFTLTVKPEYKGNVVIDEMKTWFNDSTYEVVARNYSLSYSAGVYDFDVQMEVQMTHYKDLLVPALMRYTGNWKVLFKGRERGAFTATLFDFN
ncbi:hypothetical protein [Ferruginibacter albus]|uniref:hypothetical protein n=1 Tax=Ferruginibacter albus TaxID=2875540 RepID=UPI001CC725C6|nr:hypothetical protein [Ferruginibacter albus]